MQKDRTTRRVIVQGLGSLGEGLSRDGDLEIFTPKVAPGDEIEIEIVGHKKGRALSRLVQVVKPSPTRVNPRCRHFMDCGGCDFQHLDYAQQLDWKLRMTKHWIRRSPLEPHLKNISFDVIASPQPYGYRQRVRLQVKDQRLHFFKPHSHDLVEISECPILASGFFEALAAKAQTMPDTKDWAQASLQHYEIAGHRMQVSDDCFFQANLEMNQLMWQRLKEDILQISHRKSALDLYCGIGNFSIPARDYFESVMGVEREGESLGWARQNSDKVEWCAGDAADIVRDLNRHKRVFDWVLLDPPRTGALETCRELVKMHPARITYVSCSLDSLIPDLTHLTKSGGYRLDRWSVADLFPQTHHIESIVSLVTK